jgi:hypothetical protein
MITLPPPPTPHQVGYYAPLVRLLQASLTHDAMCREGEGRSNALRDALSMDALLGLISRIESNSFGLLATIPTSSDNDSSGSVGRGIYPFAAMFNHSCDFNCEQQAFRNGAVSLLSLPSLPILNLLIFSY